MITLTTAAPVKTVLGASATVDYDKFVISNIGYDVLQNIVDGVVSVSASSDPTMTVVTGRLRIDVASGAMSVIVDQLDFRRSLVLTTGQKNVVIALLAAAQQGLEEGLITLNVVDGIFSAGT